MARWVDGKIGLGCDRQREPGRKGIEKGWVDRVRVRWSSSNNRSCLWDGGLAQHISSAAAAKATDKRAPTVAKVSTAPQYS